MALDINALLEKAAAAEDETAAEYKRIAAEARSLLDRAEAADDYRQISNAMGKHVFGYYGQIQRQELEKYWSKRDDIVYAHGSMAYYGRKDVFNYYIGMTEAMKAKARETAKRVYGQDFAENEGPGYKVMNMLLSPYIEIAGDRQTARGVWMAYAYMTHLGSDGKPDTSLGLSRYAGEFVREDGCWKLWHRVDYMECGLNYTGPDAMVGPPPAAKGPGGSEGGPPKGGPSASPIAYVGQKTLVQRSGGGMGPCEAAFSEPAIPEPYDTWREAESYVVIECDGYKSPHPGH